MHLTWLRRMALVSWIISAVVAWCAWGIAQRTIYVQRQTIHDQNKHIRAQEQALDFTIEQTGKLLHELEAARRPKVCRCFGWAHIIEDAPKPATDSPAVPIIKPPVTYPVD